MSHTAKPIPITSTERLVVKVSNFRGQGYVHLNVMADDIARRERRTDKGFSFPLLMLPIVINVLQTFCAGPERTGKR